MPDPLHQFNYSSEEFQSLCREHSMFKAGVLLPVVLSINSKIEFSVPVDPIAPKDMEYYTKIF
jgi:hypothetical protein